MINLKGKVSEATEEGKRLKVRLGCARLELVKTYKVTLDGARVKIPTCPVANIQAQLEFFDVTSCVKIDCARSFLCQAC